MNEGYVYLKVKNSRKQNIAPFDIYEEFSHIIQAIKSERKEHGLIVNGWLLCEIINDTELKLTDTDKAALKRILKKIERQFNAPYYYK